MDKDKLTPNTEQPPQQDEKTEILQLQNTTNNQLNQIKDGVEVPSNYGKTFLDYMNEYPETIQKLQSFIRAPETLESRSQKIENIW